MLVSGKGGSRFGNGHPSIVPYTTYRAADAMMALAVGNDGQFARTAEVLGHPEWASDPRFKANRARVENRAAIDGLIGEVLARDSADAWLAKLKAPACLAARSTRSPARSKTRTRRPAA